MNPIHIAKHTEARTTALLCAFFVLGLAACSGDTKDISLFDRQNPPDQEIFGVLMRRSSRAMLQMEMETPHVLKYEQPTPITRYPEGVNLRFYDDSSTLTATLTAGSAVTYDKSQVLYATDSVVVVDYTTGDTIYLQDIVWRQMDSIFFSNHPVRAVNGQRITLGDGFVSDERMAHLRITRQRGTIEFQE